jgi:hypothetical protein
VSEWRERVVSEWSSNKWKAWHWCGHEKKWASYAVAAGERERERNTPKRASRAVMSLWLSSHSLTHSLSQKPTRGINQHIPPTYYLLTSIAEHSFRHNTIYSYQPRGSAAPHARPPITTSARPDLPPRRTITASIKSVTVMTNYLLTKQKSDKKNVTMGASSLTYLHVTLLALLLTYLLTHELTNKFEYY